MEENGLQPLDDSEANLIAKLKKQYGFGTEKKSVSYSSCNNTIPSVNTFNIKNISNKSTRTENSHVISYGEMQKLYKQRQIAELNTYLHAHLSPEEYNKLYALQAYHRPLFSWTSKRWLDKENQPAIDSKLEKLNKMKEIVQKQERQTKNLQVDSQIDVNNDELSGSSMKIIEAVSFGASSNTFFGPKNDNLNSPDSTGKTNSSTCSII